MPGIVGAVVSSARSLDDNLYAVYEALEKHRIVDKRELAILTAWLKDLAALERGAPAHDGGSH